MEIAMLVAICAASTFRKKMRMPMEMRPLRKEFSSLKAATSSPMLVWAIRFKSREPLMSSLVKPRSTPLPISPYSAPVIPYPRRQILLCLLPIPLSAKGEHLSLI